MCDRQAMVHLSVIVDKKQINKHFCEECASLEASLVAGTHEPIKELMAKFKRKHNEM
jgi:protein-arginine kinase activator protein McsA